MTNLIYEPRGKAREYSPLALNLYLGCTHQCKYCYAPQCLKKRPEDYFNPPPPRQNVIKLLKNEVAKNVPKNQVLLSFIGDVYCETQDRNHTTTDALHILCNANVPTAILTKGGKRCLQDLNLFKSFDGKIQVGATLTFDNERDSKEWESGAASPDERLETLKELHAQGIRTFASFEPVIAPKQSLAIMEKGLDFIDVYKVGKLNNFQGIDKTIDWNEFLVNVVTLLRQAKKQFYIKHDLRNSAPSVELYDIETHADAHNVR